MIDVSNFQLHIFDLDDTLVNTKEAYWFAQGEAVRNAFPQLTNEQMVRLTPRLKWLCHIFGSSNIGEYMEAFLKSEPDLFPFKTDVLDKIVSSYYLHFKSRFTCFEGVKEFLNNLKISKRTTAIVSNGNVESQLSKLKQTGLLCFFPEQHIFISGKYAKKHKKPSPFMVKKAFNKAKIKAEQTIFYGNSDVDILAGKLAGVKTAHFSKSTGLSSDFPQFAAPHFTFPSWSALEKSNWL